MNFVRFYTHYGLSREEMASILKISVKIIDEIERGEFTNALGVEALVIIRDIFGVSIADQFERRLTARDFPRPPHATKLWVEGHGHWWGLLV